jgi:hypothetical protein
LCLCGVRDDVAGGVADDGGVKRVDVASGFAASRGSVAAGGGVKPSVFGVVGFTSADGAVAVYDAIVKGWADSDCGGD